jgi:hypothetical protein
MVSLTLKGRPARPTNCFGAAAYAAQPLLHVKRGDIAPDRRLRRGRQLNQFLHRHDRLFLDGGQDDAMALFFVHDSSHRPD